MIGYYFKKLDQKMVIGPVSYSPGLVDGVRAVNPDEWMQGKESLHTGSNWYTEESTRNLPSAIWCVQTSLGEGHDIEDIRRSTAWWRRILQCTVKHSWTWSCFLQMHEVLVKYRTAMPRAKAHEEGNLVQVVS